MQFARSSTRDQTTRHPPSHPSQLWQPPQGHNHGVLHTQYLHTQRPSSPLSDLRQVSRSPMLHGGHWFFQADGSSGSHHVVGLKGGEAGGAEAAGWVELEVELEDVLAVLEMRRLHAGPAV